MPFTRKQEALVRSLKTRQGRRKSGLCLCEGIKACRELVSAGPDLVEFSICSENFRRNLFPDLEFAVIPEKKFAELSTFENSEGVLVVARRPETDFGGPPSGPFTLLLDRISDPGNLGTIIRTARAAGLPELWITEGGADPFGDKVVRAALGFQFALRIRTFADLADAVCEFRKNGSERIYIASPQGGKDCFSEAALFDRSLIVFGNESHGAGRAGGVSQISIPMPGGIDSINVAQSVTVILFEAVRRKILGRG